MTYNVFSGTLNPTHYTSLSRLDFHCECYCNNTSAVCVCFLSFDFSEMKWRDVRVSGGPVPSARYGHSAVVCQVRSVILFHYVEL